MWFTFGKQKVHAVSNNMELAKYVSGEAILLPYLIIIKGLNFVIGGDRYISIYNY